MRHTVQHFKNGYLGDALSLLDEELGGFTTHNSPANYQNGTAHRL